MKYLKVIANALLIPAAFFGIPILNLIIRFGLEDGVSYERMLSSFIYFSAFSALLLTAIRTKSIKRNICILLLLTLFPCVYIGSDGFEYYYVGVCGMLWSFAEFSRPITLMHGVRTHNALILYQVYSVLFAIAISFILLRVKASYKNTLLLCNKYKYFLLACVALSVCYVLLFSGEGEIIKYWKNTAIWHKTLSYLFLYFSLLILYLITFLFTRKFIKIRFNELIAIVFILLFPVVSVSSDTFNIITADTVPSYERAVYTVPLVAALPITVKHFVVDLFSEKNVSVILYSLFQIFTVLLVFPSMLMSKTNQNAGHSD